MKDTIALDRPVSEYRLAMKEPFQLLRDQDCAGAYIDLVTKGFPLSLYLSYAKDTLFCPLAPKVYLFIHFFLGRLVEFFY